MMTNKNRPWWKNSVVYQIYPKSFNDSNNDGIGDLNGITEKLDYLEKLGIDVIWLNPIYKSPQIDNGYDISNYKEINPELGTMADFDDLLKKCHQKDIKIILDLVVNHTSDKNPWFKQAQKSSDNPYHDFYIWKKPKNGREPNNWGSSFGGSAWTYVDKTAEYYLHLFAKEQPDLNWDNPKVRESVYDIMKFWLNKGIDGFRMDVISLISKDTRFSDGPIIQNKKYASYYQGAANGPKVHKYLQEMNREVLSKYDIMTVGETPHTNSSEAVLYSARDRHELNMVFGFDHMHLDYGKYGKFSDKRFKLIDLKRVLTDWQNEMSDHQAWNSLYWSNHDQARAVSRFGNDNQKYREKSAKMLGTVLHMLQGTPYIFEGEEIGMTNALFPDITDYQDVETKSIYKEFTEQNHLSKDYTMECIHLKSRDNARTPMQWNETENAGFSNVKPWLKTNPNYKEINVKGALENKNSVFYFYQKLIKLRHELPIITTGKYELIDASNPYIYTYLREEKNHALIVIANFTDREINYSIPKTVYYSSSKLIIGNQNLPNEISNGELDLSAYGCAVYELSN